MKLALIILCAFVSGWFARGAVQDALDGIYNWREMAAVALMAAFCVVVLVIAF